MTLETALLLAIGSGVLAILYGLGSVRLDPGAAGRQCADAGDRRCHSGRRAGVPQPAVLDHRPRRRGPVRGPRIGAELADGGRFRGGRAVVGTRGLHRHVHLGARERAHRAGCPWRHQRRAQGRVPRRRDHRNAGGGLGAARRGRILSGHVAACWAIPERRCGLWSASPSAARSSRSSRAWAAASSPRARTSAPTSSARSRPEYRRTIRAIPRSSPTTWATTSATAPAWPPTCSRPTPSRWSPPCCSAAW